MSSSQRYSVVIPAAGVGRRMGSEQPKQYIEIDGKTILEHTLEPFIQHPDIAQIVVVVSADDPYCQSMNCLQQAKVNVAYGGQERCHSVMNGIMHLRDTITPDEWVLVHDAARPCIHQSEISLLIEALKAHPVGGILAWPVRDTMKRSDDQGKIVDTIEREHLWHALTPQMFRWQILFDALNEAHNQGQVVTDEAQAVERMGLQPQLVAASCYTSKVTTPADLQLAQQYLAMHRRIR